MATLKNTASEQQLYDTERYPKVAIKIFTTKQSIQTGLCEIKMMRKWYDGAGRTRSSCTVVVDRRSESVAPSSSEKKREENDQKENMIETGQLDLSYHQVALRSIGRLLGCVECPNGALALKYELCGSTLSSQLWSMKGEFYKGERVYKVTQGILHQDLFLREGYLLKVLLKTLVEVLLLFDDCGIMHCDIKPDNILVNYDSATQQFKSIKLIDFGSSVDVQSIVDQQGNIVTSQLPSSTTPEYLAPELLHAREGTYGQQGDMTVDDCINPDMWAIGSVMLEIVR